MPSDPSAKPKRRAVRLGKYEVVAHIATGGMGAVYKARDTELNRDVALKILRHFALSMEYKYEVSIEPEAVRQAIVLSANYILNDQLPAKALKILHRVCQDIDYERKHKNSPRNRVTSDDVVSVVSKQSGVPEETLRGIADRSDYEQSLREVLFGQDHAVRAVATELGLTDSDKPERIEEDLGIGDREHEEAGPDTEINAQDGIASLFTPDRCQEAGRSQGEERCQRDQHQHQERQEIQSAKDTDEADQRQSGQCQQGHLGESAKEFAEDDFPGRQISRQ